MKIYLAVDMTQGEALTKQGYFRRLVSYFTMRNDEGRVAGFIKTGLIHTKQKRKGEKKNDKQGKVTGSSKRRSARVS